MCFRIFNPGCIQRENRWTIRKWMFVLFLLVLFVCLILHFTHQSFHYCSGPFGDSSHLKLSWHDNYDKFMDGKCSKSKHDDGHVDKLAFIARIIFNEGKPKAFCAGTLIFNNIIVTAAHCLEPLMNHINKLEVHLGTQSNIEKFVDFTAKNIKIHEKYDNEKFSNDIALIKLDRKVNSSSTTSTLCIPFDDKNVRNNLTMGEWDTENIKNIEDPKINETTVNGIDNQKCGQELYNLVQVVQQSRYSSEISEENRLNEIRKNSDHKPVNFEQFCASEKSVKQGNSGMPVYGNSLETEVPTIYGLVSFGVKDGKGPGSPTVLTKIYDYRHWILCNAY